MKILLDQSVPALAASLLREFGHDATHGSEIGMQRSPDIDYLLLGAADGSVVVTMDADFHSLLATLEMRAPSTIHLRIHNPTEAVAAAVIHDLCLRFATELNDLCVVTYKSSGTKWRPLPIKKKD